MLQAREVIDAHMIREGHITLAVSGDVSERGRSAPIFIGSVGEENLGHNFFGGGSVEQSSSLSGQRIVFR